MGANAINTALEKIAPRVAEISEGRVHLRILSNLADRRLARASCKIPLEALAFAIIPQKPSVMGSLRPGRLPRRIPTARQPTTKAS